jgi:hypothetical protein
MGIAMGTPVAVSLSNIFLGMLEYDIFCDLTKNNFKLPIIFCRFIDDCFGIFHDNNSKDFFLHLYNNSIDSIKITSNSNNKEQVFLDLCLFKGFNYDRYKILDVKLYQKPLNNYLYIPPHSFHTPYMFNGFILSNFNRIRFKCNNDNDFYQIAYDFYTRLYNRGYPHDLIHNIFKLTSTRKMLINKYSTPNTYNNSNPSSPVVFKTMWNPRYKFFNLHKCLNISQKPDNYDYSVLNNIIVCFKRGKNLSELIGKLPSDINKENIS